MPWDAIPAARADDSISPDTRGSRPMTAVGRRLEPAAAVPVRTRAAAAPRRSARGAVSTLFARPRTPSVTKSLLIGGNVTGYRRRPPSFPRPHLPDVRWTTPAGRKEAKILVGPVGLEPTTCGLKVRSSTN